MWADSLERDANVIYYSTLSIRRSDLESTRWTTHCSRHVCAGRPGITFRQSALLNFYASENSSLRYASGNGAARDIKAVQPPYEKSRGKRLPPAPTFTIIILMLRCKSAAAAPVGLFLCLRFRENANELFLFSAAFASSLQLLRSVCFFTKLSERYVKSIQAASMRSQELDCPIKLKSNMRSSLESLTVVIATLLS